MWEVNRINLCAEADFAEGGLVCQRNAIKSDHQELTVYYSYATHIHYMYNVYTLLCIHI